MRTARPLIAIRNLSIAFQKPRAQPVPAVFDLDLDIYAGQTLAIVGESGSGKSITALSLMGLLPRKRTMITGEATYGEVDLLHANKKTRQRINGRELAMIFQEPMSALNPLLTIGYQLQEPLRQHRQLDAAAARQAAHDLLVQVGLTKRQDWLSCYPFQLSGGERQRIMIAMALATKPKLLIADEPTTALDVTVQAQILTLMQELVQGAGTAIVLITHDLGVVAALAERVAIMYCGHILEIASVADFFASPCHPYSQSLLRAMPRIDARSDRLYVIPGHVPKSSEYRQGCPFFPRCDKALPRCANEKPLLQDIQPGRQVRCHLFDSTRAPGRSAV